MQTQNSKFLLVATLFCLSVAPAASQDRAANMARANAHDGVSTLNFSGAKPAHIGEIRAQDVEIYVQQMRAAIQIRDPARQDTAVAAARLELAQRTQKPLTARTIAELDGVLDIGGISPQLGATG